jgi:hypothetical protein
VVSLQTWPRHLAVFGSVVPDTHRHGRTLHLQSKISQEEGLELRGGRKLNELELV